MVENRDTGSRWISNVDKSEIKDRFLSIYKNDPPGFNKFDLSGFKDISQSNAIDIYLSTENVPDTAHVLWPNKDISGISICLRCFGPDFCSVSFWYSPDKMPTTKKMRYMEKEDGIVESQRKIDLSGALTSRIVSARMTELSPVIRIA